ncbi:MAG: hypothetical protein P1U40_14030 [Coxiellaceae bacterium]|nr:hypothetical protein [Coxiellaceae bacterium]
MRRRIEVNIKNFDDALLLRDSNRRRRRSLPAGAIEEVTKGDMHGNAMLLIFTLIAEDVLNVSKEQFDALWRIYDKPVADLSFEDLVQFITILNDMTANEDRCSLSFIGDMLADRGANDWFTLKVIEALDAKEVPFDIVFSNHDAGFVQCMNGREVTHSPKTSLEALEALLANRESGATVKDVKNIYNKAYLKHLKLVSYRLDETQTPSLVLRTHAPVGLDTIKGVAVELGVAYDESTPQALAESIDRMNLNFSERLKAADPAILDLLEQPAAGAAASHLFTLIWNRAGPTAEPKQRLAPLRLDSESGYAIAFVHGHDGEYMPSEVNRINTDGELGAGPELETGNYVVHRTNRIDPALAAQARAAESKMAEVPQAGPALPSATPAVRPVPDTSCCLGFRMWRRRRQARKQEEQKPTRSQVAPAENKR